MSLPVTDETRAPAAPGPAGADGWSVALWLGGALALLLAATGRAGLAVTVGVVVAAAVVATLLAARGGTSRPGLLVAAGLAALVALPVARLQVAVDPAIGGLQDETGFGSDSALGDGLLDSGGGASDAGAGPAPSTELEPQPVVVEESSRPAAAIPDDDDDGISDTISVGDSGRLTDIRVGVAITHPYVGDLTVELVAPSGQSVLLHEQGEGMNRDDLRTAYDTSSTPGLAAVLRDEVEGDWSLRVRDSVGGDTGRLDEWALQLAVE